LKIEDTNPPTLNSFLMDTPVTKLLRHKNDSVHQHPIILNHNHTVSHALSVLAKHNILSAPVVLSASAEDGESGNYLGIVDTGRYLSLLPFSASQITL
jgi:CBS domain-containing protein